MADFTVTGDTSIDASGAKAGLSKIGKGFSSAAGVAVGAAKGMLTALAGVSTAIAGVGVAAVKYNANLEQYSTSFEVMTGSAEAAAAVVADLKKMGASTPFEFEDLAKSTQTLMSFGRSVSESSGDLQMLGDISQGNAAKLETLTRAFGKMTSSGKVSLEDINMMIDSGFNPLQEIVDSTGESMGSLYDRISKGTISVDEITAAMEKSTAAGGKYFGSMEKQSQTINGQLSTLKDNAQSLLGEIFAGVTESVGGEVLPMVNDWISQLSAAFAAGGVEGVVAEFGTVLSQAIGALGESAPQFIEVATGLINSFIDGMVAVAEDDTAMTGIITALVESLASIGSNLFDAGLSIIGKLLEGIAASMPSMMETWQENLQAMIQSVIEFAPSLIASGAQIIGQLVIGLLQAVPQIIDGAIALITTLTDALSTDDGSMGAGIEIVTNLLMGIADKLPDLLLAAVDLILAIVEGIIENLPEILLAAAQIVAKLAEGLIKAIPKLLVAVVRLLWDMVTMFNDVDWLKIGKNIIDGIAKGIVGAASNLATAAVDAAKAAFEATKKFLGIKSPSTLYRDKIGEMIPEGGAEGIEEGTPKFVKAGVSSVQAMMDASSAALGANQGTIATAYTPAATVAMQANTKTLQEAPKSDTIDYDKIYTAVKEGASDAKPDVYIDGDKVTDTVDKRFSEKEVLKGRYAT